MTAHGSDIETAAKQLNEAEGNFSTVEDLYFKRKASVEELRQAWDARDRALRALQAAHKANAA
jgi:hypothetical protein